MKTMKTERLLVPHTSSDTPSPLTPTGTETPPPGLPRWSGGQKLMTGSLSALPRPVSGERAYRGGGGGCGWGGGVGGWAAVQWGKPTGGVAASTLDVVRKYIPALGWRLRVLPASLWLETSLIKLVRSERPTSNRGVVEFLCIKRVWVIIEGHVSVDCKGTYQTVRGMPRD
jgi:hypothetical protein